MFSYVCRLAPCLVECSCVLRTPLHSPQTVTLPFLSLSSQGLAFPLHLFFLCVVLELSLQTRMASSEILLPVSPVLGPKACATIILSNKLLLFIYSLLFSSTFLVFENSRGHSLEATSICLLPLEVTKTCILCCTYSEHRAHSLSTEVSADLATYNYIKYYTHVML